MAINTASLTKAGISQFADIPSQDSDSIKLFGFTTGLKDLLGAPLLTSIGNNVPFVDYDPNYLGGNYLQVNSPNIGKYDFRGNIGFSLDLGLHLDYQYDFGSLTANATVSANRIDGLDYNNVYSLLTDSVSVNASLASVAATEPFKLGLRIGGNNDTGAPGNFTGGLSEVGIYKNGNPYATTNALLFSSDLNEEFNLVDIGQNDPPKTFDEKFLNGSVGVPKLPQLSVAAGGTGAAAIGAADQRSGTANFAALNFEPIGLIPAIGTLNSGNVALIESYFVDAGFDYTILGLSAGLTLGARQTLTTTIEEVRVLAVAEEQYEQDAIGPGGVYARAALDPDGDGYVEVSRDEGRLGETLELGNFTGGARTDTRITEYYSITLRIDSDVDLVLGGNLNLSFFNFSAYINPILIDELRINIGPLFAESLSFDIAAIDLHEGDILVTFTNAAVLTHYIDTTADFRGTDGDDQFDLQENGQDTVDGRAGDDIINGDTAPNLIFGGDGGDFLRGSKGAAPSTDNDTILGGAGWDIIFGGAGDDRLETGAGGSPGGAEAIAGGLGNDLIIGAATASLLVGQEGNDTIRSALADGGNQRFEGGDGTDLLVADASAIDTDLVLDFNALGGSGVLLAAIDLLGVPLRLETSYSSIELFDFTAGRGNDFVSGSKAADTLAGGAGNDVLRGDLGADRLAGDDGRDTIYGGDGGDTVRGGSGDDNLLGGTGDDLVEGDAGDDTLSGENGTDLLFGGAGNDALLGGYDTDILFGDDGDDTLSGQGGAAGEEEILYGGAGNDLLIGSGTRSFFDAGTGDDRLEIGKGGGLALGGRGSDRFVIAHPALVGVGGGGGGVGAGGGGVVDTGGGGGGGFVSPATIEIRGDDSLAGPGDDIDILEMAYFNGFISAFDPVFVPGLIGGFYAQLLSADGALAGGISYSGIEAFDISLTDFGDSIIGGSHGDTLRGRGGNDYLDGSDGADVLDGGAGSDTLVGSFADVFIGGAGSDVVILAGNGESRGYIINLRAAVGANGATPISDNRTLGLDSIERLVMSSGGAGNDVVAGGGLSDVLIGGAGNDKLEGDGGDDLITAGQGSDTVRGGAGNDLIDGRESDPPGEVRGILRFGEYLYGDAGNDQILSSSTAIIVEGGGGNDSITAADGAAIIGLARATLDGGTGADRIQGSDRAELIIGGLDPSLDRDIVEARPGGLPDFDINDAGDSAYDGNDTIFAGGGDDSVRGGYGADSITGDDGNDSISGGSGNDSIDGGAGTDTLRGGSGNDLLTGGSADDEIGDQLFGDDGNDTLTGSEGTDRLDGGAGNDLISGGGTNSLGYSPDELTGGSGNDTLSASGDALLFGGDGDDRYTLGDGGQIVRAVTSAAAGLDRVFGFAPAFDVVAFSGPGLGFENLRITDLESGVLLDFVGVPDSPAVLLVGLTSQDLGPPSITIDGAPVAQDDIVLVSSNTLGLFDAGLFLANDLGDAKTLTAIDTDVGVVATLFGGRALVATGSSDGSFEYTLTSSDGSDVASVAVRTIAVTAGDDDLALAGPGQGAVASYVATGNGNDRVVGTGAADQLFGDDGNDTLSGNSGNDIVSGGSGNDSLTGGAGNDSLIGGTGNDTLVDYNGNDTLVGGDGNDRYYIANGGGNVATIVELVDGGVDGVFTTGSFTLVAEIENGTLNGTAAGDITGNALGNVLTGNAGVNNLIGDAGNDRLVAGAGDDGLNGGSGSDTLIGGSGADMLRGGSEADRFAWQESDVGSTDSIVDFNAVEGDLIDLAAIDARPGIDGNQAFAFIGDAGFSGAGGELRVTVQRGLYLVEADSNGDLVADVSILVTSALALGAADFML